MASHRNSRDGPRRVDLAIVAALIVAVVAVFGRSIGFDFVNFDDGDYVTQNAHVLEGLTAESLWWAITAFHSGHWHPLTWMSLMLDTTLFGPGPGARHAVNVALHAANAALLYAILVVATGRRGRSAVVAALFALHPLRVESVAWISERKDVLSGFFFLLTLGAWVRYGRAPSFGRYACVLVAFAAGLLAKPMLVTVPAVLLLIDVWPLCRWQHNSHGRLIAEKMPLAALAAASAFVTLASQAAAGAMESAEIVPLTRRFVTAANGYWAYLGKTLWPVDLAVFYPSRPSPFVPGLAAGLGFLALTSLLLYAGRRRHAIAVGWLWFAGMLVPVIGIVHVGGQAYADRFTYLPHVGLFLAMVWIVADTVAERSRKIALSLVAVAAFACLSAWQVGHWRNTITLFTRALDVTEGNYMAHNNLGVALADQGRLDEASMHYAEAVRANPTWPEALTNYGNVFAWRGDWAGARAQYERALQIRPDMVVAENNLATTYSREGNFARAAEHYRRALTIDPDYGDARFALADALERLGQFEEALAQYRRTLEQQPDRQEVRARLSALERSTGSF